MININYVLKVIMISSFFIFISCDKLKEWDAYKRINEEWPETVVQGKVTNAFTGLPISNATIIIYRIKKEYYWHPAYEPILRFNCDDNGNFAGKFYADVNYYHDIDAIKEDICFGAGAEISNGEKNIYNLAGTSKGTIEFHLKNQFPYDSTDKICINHINFIHFREMTFPAICQTGINIDVYCQFPIMGDIIGATNVELGWEVIKNNISKSFADTIYIPACETVNYTINY